MCETGFVCFKGPCISYWNQSSAPIATILELLAINQRTLERYFDDRQGLTTDKAKELRDRVNCYLQAEYPAHAFRIDLAAHTEPLVPFNRENLAQHLASLQWSHEDLAERCRMQASEVARYFSASACPRIALERIVAIHLAINECAQNEGGQVDLIAFPLTDMPELLQASIDSVIEPIEEIDPDPERQERLETSGIKQYIRFANTTCSMLQLPLPLGGDHQGQFPISDVVHVSQLIVRQLPLLPPSIGFVGLREKNTTQPVFDAIDRYRCLVILGSTGSGKTSLCKALTYSLTKDPISPHPSFDAGESDKSRQTIPIRVDLAQIPERTLSKIESIRMLIFNWLRFEMGDVADGIASQLWDICVVGAAIVLIDGLDSLPTEQQSALLRLINQECVLYPNLRVFLTARFDLEHAVKLELSGQFAISEIAPLSSADRQGFARLLVGTLNRNAALPSESRDLIFQAIEKSSLSNCYMVALACQVMVSSPNTCGADFLFRVAVRQMLRRADNEMAELVYRNLSKLAHEMEKQHSNEILERDVISATDFTSEQIDWLVVAVEVGLLKRRSTQDEFFFMQTSFQFIDSAFQGYFLAEAQLDGGSGHYLPLALRLRNAIDKAPLVTHKIAIDPAAKNVCYALCDYFSPAFQEVFVRRFLELQVDEAVDLLEFLIEKDKTEYGLIALICVAESSKNFEAQIEKMFRKISRLTKIPDGRHFNATTLFDRAVQNLLESQHGAAFCNSLASSYLVCTNDSKRTLAGWMIQNSKNRRKLAVSDINSNADDEFDKISQLWDAACFSRRHQLEAANLSLEEFKLYVNSGEHTAWFALSAMVWTLESKKEKIDVSWLSTFFACIPESYYSNWLCGLVALIASRAQHPTVFDANDWILELANIADGNKERASLEALPECNANTDYYQAIVACSRVLAADDTWPPAKELVSISMGRVGLFGPGMVKPLLQHLVNVWATDRDEAAFYLGVICSRSKPLRRIIESQVEEGTDDEFLGVRLFFLLIYLDDFSVTKRLYQRELHLAGVIRKDLGMALAQGTDPRGLSMIRVLAQYGDDDAKRVLRFSSQQKRVDNSALRHLPEATRLFIDLVSKDVKGWTSALWKRR